MTRASSRGHLTKTGSGPAGWYWSSSPDYSGTGWAHRTQRRDEAPTGMRGGHPGCFGAVHSLREWHLLTPQSLSPPRNLFPIWIRQLCVAKQIADDVCGKHSTFEVIAGQELDRAGPVIFVLPVRFNVMLSVHTFSLNESRFSRNRGRNSRYQRLSECSDPTLILATRHYGLRYGLAPATGNFQRLRGRPPLVSPLKSCMSRSFTAVTRVQIPSGTPTLSTTCKSPTEFCRSVTVR